MSYGDNEVFVKCDAREQLPIFTAEADQLALLARNKSVRSAGSVRRRQRSRLQLPAAGVSAAETLDAHGAYCLGQQLAHLHQWSEQPQFGLDFDSDLTTTRNPTPGSAAGRNSSPNSASAGSCSWRPRKA